LVCPFPLALGTHLHHVIARDDGGPNHPLNLVALCPNHHLALELVRRHIAPKETDRAAGWETRAGAAAEFIRSFAGDSRSLFDQLSEPHPLRQPIRDGVDASLRTALAKDIARADTIILLRANLARPSALLVWRIAQGRTEAPANDADYAAAASAVAQAVCGLDVAEVVEAHLDKLGLPCDRGWVRDLTL
jgi:HNH endonuclease